MPAPGHEEDISELATILQKVKLVFTPFAHDLDYLAMRTRFRGLMRSYVSLEDKLTGKPKKRKKVNANPGTDSADAERAST